MHVEGREMRESPMGTKEDKTHNEVPERKRKCLSSTENPRKINRPAKMKSSNERSDPSFTQCLS